MRKLLSVFFLLTIMPFVGLSQDLTGEIASLQHVLNQLYQEMIPLCSGLIGVGQAIAGFAALWYIGSRIWRHIAQAEPIDFYPLFRPFVLGFCIAFFPAIVSLMNAILEPVVQATTQMVGKSDKAINELLRLKEEQIKSTEAWQMYVGYDGAGDRDRWYKYTFDEAPSQEGMLEGVGNDIKFAMAKASYAFRNSVKEWLSEILAILFHSAALCINTLRTFQLIVMAILGPLVFGLCVFDGFTHLLHGWLTRYIQVFLWLPVANIFGSIIGRIQENMLKIDLTQIQEAGDTFFSRTDMAYLIFLIIGIVGYFTVPAVANYIVNVGTGDAYSRLVSNTFTTTASAGAAAVGGAAGATIVGAQQTVNHMASAFRGTAEPHKLDSATKADSSFMSERMKGNS